MEEFDITAPLQSETLKDSELNSLFPKKILKYIFSLLPPPDLKAAVLVCKLWAEVGQAPDLWNWVAFKVCQENMESMPERLQQPRMKKVKEMKMNPCNTTVSNDFMVALAMHSGLRAVIVIHRPCPHVLEHCPHHCWETNFCHYCKN